MDYLDNICEDDLPCDDSLPPCEDIYEEDGCVTSTPSDDILYTGPDGECSNVEKGDTLTEVIEKLNQSVCFTIANPDRHVIVAPGDTMPGTLVSKIIDSAYIKWQVVKVLGKYFMRPVITLDNVCSQCPTTTTTSTTSTTTSTSTSTSTSTTLEPPMCCPDGYMLSEDGTYCYIFDEVAATPPSDSRTSVEVNYIHYSRLGSIVFNPGYDINGVGPFSQINTFNTFWRNEEENNVDGPMNRNALWSEETITDEEQTIGFSICLNVPVAKTYYIGFAFDNKGIIKVDANTVINFDSTTAGYDFQTWAIYPIFLQAGDRIIEITGVNTPGPLPNPGAIAFEIYDNTETEIASANSYDDLNVLYRSSQYIGQNIQLGSQGYGFSCPSDYSLSACDDPVVCKGRITTPLILCSEVVTSTSTTIAPTTTTTTSTTTTLPATTTTTTSTSTTTTSSTTTVPATTSTTTTVENPPETMLRVNKTITSDVVVVEVTDEENVTTTYTSPSNGVFTWYYVFDPLKVYDIHVMLTPFGRASAPMTLLDGTGAEIDSTPSGTMLMGTDVTSNNMGIIINVSP